MSRITAAAVIERVTTDPLSYEFLGTKEALAVTEEALEMLLEEAKAVFHKIENQNPNTSNFGSVVDCALGVSVILRTLWTALGNIHSTNGSETTRLLIEQFQPKLSAYDDLLALSQKHYALLKHVERSARTLSPMQKRSLFLLRRYMERAGVALSEEKKKRLRAINTQLGTLEHRFSENATKSRAIFSYRITDRSKLGEMPEEDIAAALSEAKKRKMKGWVFTLSQPSYTAIARYCTDREIRKTLYLANGTVATKGAFDNRPLILKILRLRKEKASLLGHKNFANVILEDRMAKSVGNILKTMNPYAAQCKKKAKEEIVKLRRFSGLKDFQWWDLSFYSNLLRTQQLHLDEKELSQYFELNQTLTGMFQIAKRLFGVECKPLKSVSKDIQRFEVRRKGKRIGYLLLDLFARPTKRGGAWCDALGEPIVRDGKHMKLAVPIIVGNFGKGKKQTLLRFFEVDTLFHEFGHALHNLLSETPYYNLYAFHTEWDFVELPSQLLENWCWEPSALKIFARHYRTKKPMPSKLLTQLIKSRTFLKGIDSLILCEFATLDLAFHIRKPFQTVHALDAFRALIGKRFEILPSVPTKRHASFSHIFSGGYAAGYYSYLWSQILEADVFEQFKKKGILNAKLGEKLRTDILSAGASKPGIDLFRAFVGRNPTPKALVKRNGL